MTFDFFKVVSSLDSINIDDIGNVCLVCSNDESLQWYLRIKTDLGWCEVEQFGPLKIDSNRLDMSFVLSYQPFEFSEHRLIKTIKDFLNNDKREITCAEIITPEEFTSRLEGIEHVW